MSVMSCSRNGCDGILCDRYSPHFGYICDSCFDELVNSGFTTDIKEFMETHKSQGFGDDNKDLIYERYNRIFLSGRAR